MENDFSLGEKFNYVKDVSLYIELNKICYSPGEIIHGTIILTPKQNSEDKELLTPYAVWESFAKPKENDEELYLKYSDKKYTGFEQFFDSTNKVANSKKI